MLLMELFSDVFEADIPDTKYGYWVSPDGEFLPVGFQNHDAVMSDWSLENLGYKINTHTAMRKGWVRIVYMPEKELAAELSAHKMTIKTLVAMRKLAARPVPLYTVALHGAAPGSDLGYGKSFYEKGPFLLYLQKTRIPNPSSLWGDDERDDLTEAVEIPETTYGYWIDTEGRAIPVENARHGIIALSYGKDGYGGAFRDGWIRVISEGYNTFYCQFQLGRPKARGIITLRNIVRQREYERGYNLDVVDYDLDQVNDTSRYYTSGSFLAAVNDFRRDSADASRLP